MFSYYQSNRQYLVSNYQSQMHNPEKILCAISVYMQLTTFLEDGTFYPFKHILGLISPELLQWLLISHWSLHLWPYPSRKSWGPSILSFKWSLRNAIFIVLTLDVPQKHQRTAFNTLKYFLMLVSSVRVSCLEHHILKIPSYF